MQLKIEITLLDFSVSFLIIVNNTHLGISKTPQSGYYLRISKGGNGSPLTSYQLLFVFPLKKDIPIFFSVGGSGLVQLGVLFPEFPCSVLLG